MGVVKGGALCGCGEGVELHVCVVKGWSSMCVW